MESLRFSGFALVLFVLAFIGISWASKGFPMLAMRVAPMKPDARLPTFEESVKQGIRKDWEASRTNQSDGDKERDKLRLALWQASIGYKLSPCDPTMKKNLVEAVTHYTAAWGNMAGCSAGTCTGDDKRLDAAAAAFQTPADKRIHESLREAYERGGVTKKDFPRSVRDNIMLFSRAPVGGLQESCRGNASATRAP
jgi:hypothetical protein